MAGLPEEFEKRMKELLKEEYEEFRASYEKERSQGLRPNLLKMSVEEGKEKLAVFGLRPVPWTGDGFYYDNAARPGKHPYHDAGLYYIQEPSAMAVVSLLDPQPGDRVLDLCAAPGGKTTHIASRLQGNGFLLSNEINLQRAKILSQNVERMGIHNAVVTSEDSEKLAGRFWEFFDKIVVDAPCSGEGMFRKDEDARGEWSVSNVRMCAERQAQILHNASLMVKPGGRIAYSTCTFSPEENERTIENFLISHPEFEIEDRSDFMKEHGYAGMSSGRPEWGMGQREDLSYTFRIWPHKADGEGHYLAVLQKKGESKETGQTGEKKRTEPSFLRDKALLAEIERFLKEICPGAKELSGRTEWLLFGDQLYLVPKEMTDMKGLKVVRAGLHVAVLKKNRLEPAHALALWLKKEEAARTCDMDASGEEILRYRKGEAVSLDGEKGWTLMCVDGYPIGWAKQSGGILKNHYPKGLRLLK